MSGPDVFLSYNHPDAPRARQFARGLEEEGFSVWWDATLRSGETFDEVIERALLESRAVVVLWSPSSVTSRWVRAEATEADRMGKLVPVTIAPCKRPIVFEMTQTADLSHWEGDRADLAWQGFVADVRHVVEGKGAGTPSSVSAPSHAPSAVEQPQRVATGRRIAFTAALLAVIALAAWLFLRPGGAETKLTGQPIEVATLSAEGGPAATLLAVTLKNSAQDVLGDSGFRTRPVEQPEGTSGLALKGSVIETAGRLKIFLQLEHLPTGETVWSGQFEDAVANADQVNVSATVAAAESLSALRDAERQDGLNLEPNEIASFIEGGNLTTTYRADRVGKSTQLFEALVDRLPRSAHAHAMLALTIDTDSNDPAVKSAAVARRRTQVAEAIRLDPAAAGAAFDVRYAIARIDHPDDLVFQENTLLDGLRQAPEFAFLSMRECAVLFGVGRIGDARPYCERAVAQRPTAAPVAWRRAWVEFISGQQGVAEQWIDRAVRYSPDSIPIALVRLAIMLESGSQDKIESAFADLKRVTPELTSADAAAMQAYLAAYAKGPAAAEKVEPLVRERYADGGLNSDLAILLLSRVGRNDGIAWVLENGAAARTEFTGLAVLYHPALASFRADPRFWKFAARNHLVAYWRKRGRWPDFCGSEMPLAQCKAMAAAAEKA